MLRFFSWDEAAAAEEVGIDIASVPADVLFHPEYVPWHRQFSRWQGKPIRNAFLQASI